MLNPICKLCLRGTAIKNSHVLSKLGYRRFVSDQTRGGASIKLHSLTDDSRQVTRQWFCPDCEKLFGENTAAQLLDRLSNSGSDRSYDGDLLRFVVSCSWRTCLFDLEHQSNFTNRKQLGPACKAWKAYLLGKSQCIRPYTQHAFIVQEPSVWNERMGMLVTYVHDLVFTQVGPLMCFGLLRSPAPHERAILKQSMIRQEGGVLTNLVSGRINYALTQGMRNTIDHADVHCNIRVREFSKSRGRAPTLWSDRLRHRN